MFAESAAPEMPSGVNAMNAAESATRTADDVHCDSVPNSGLPSEVMPADEVCTSDRVTAFTAMILTRRTSSSASL